MVETIVPIKILHVKFKNNSCTIDLPFEIDIFYEIKKSLENGKNIKHMKNNCYGFNFKKFH